MKKIVPLAILAVFVLSGCAVTRNSDGNEFASSTVRIRNRVRVLGMVGEIIETLDNEVATGVITRNRIEITSVGKGSTLFFVSNRFAEIALLGIDVSPTGAISHQILKHAEHPPTFLTSTTWSLIREDGSETIQFTTGNKGIYTVTGYSGESHSLNFSYMVTENEITLIFAVGGILITSGIIYGNVMTLLSIADYEYEVDLTFIKIEGDVQP